MCLLQGDSFERDSALITQNHAVIHRWRRLVALTPFLLATLCTVPPAARVSRREGANFNIVYNRIVSTYIRIYAHQVQFP
jgi:hypothetical protein